MGSLLSRKRSSSEAQLDSVVNQHNAPKRRRLTSTTEYIYETLFINGENSDITISALGREWQLHKVYLSQAGYFNRMFSGSWREATMDHIELDIPDMNVSVEALNLALGSLYRDDVVIDPSTIIDLMATAAFLSLDGLMKQCSEIMMENINITTATEYYKAARLYGYGQVSDACVSYLLQHFLPHLSVELLKDTSSELMSSLIGSGDLYVLQVEMDIYTMLRKWLFLRFVPDWNGSLKDLEQVASEFIKSEVNSQVWSPSFLETPDGASYIDVFVKIRIEHIITDHRSAKLLEDDRIIPNDWILSCYRRQWLHMIQLNSGQELGPDKCEDEIFKSKSLRCGRTLLSEGQYCWRWVGFNYGLDVLITCINRHVFLKRNSNPGNCSGAVGHQPLRHIVYRITVTSANDATSKVCTTGIKRLSMKKDQEFLVLTVDQALNYPMQISCNFLYYSPQPIISVGQPSTVITIP